MVGGYGGHRLQQFSPDLDRGLNDGGGGDCCEEERTGS